MSDLIRREDALSALDREMKSWPARFTDYAAGANASAGRVRSFIAAMPADTVQAQIDAAVKAEREWWITSLAPIRHQAASTRGEQAYRELPSFVVNVLTALFRKGDQP
jgi:hypothetical protein